MVNNQKKLNTKEYAKFKDYIEKRKFIKTEETKDIETETIEETYINPILEEHIMNGDYSRFVNDRKQEKEYNGDVYKIRSFLRNFEIDINNEKLMDYITRGIINEIKYLISLNSKSDFTVIKLYGKI